MRFAKSEIAKRNYQTYTKREKQRKSTFFAKKHLKSFGRVEKVRTFATVKRTQGLNARKSYIPRQALIYILIHRSPVKARERLVIKTDNHLPVSLIYIRTLLELGNLGAI